MGKTLHGGIVMVALSVIVGATLVACVAINTEAGYYVMAVVALLGIQIPGHNLRQNMKKASAGSEPLVEGESQSEELAREQEKRETQITWIALFMLGTLNN